MWLLGGRKSKSEEEILTGEKAFAEFWNYCKPLISNVSARLSDPNRLQALESYSDLNEQCNKHFKMDLRTVLHYFLQILERKSNAFSPGHFDVIDGNCRSLGLYNKVIFYPENEELQIFIISQQTHVSPIMLQLVNKSPLLSVYYNVNGIEQSIPIDGTSM